jgi:alkylhydroperoxidase family enzyme
MHTGDARKAGESEERLHMTAVWREARNFFTEKEQAALALTEAVTLVADGECRTRCTHRRRPNSTIGSRLSFSP